MTFTITAILGFVVITAAVLLAQIGFIMTMVVISGVLAFVVCIAVIVCCFVRWVTVGFWRGSAL